MQLVNVNPHQDSMFVFFCVMLVILGAVVLRYIAFAITFWLMDKFGL